MCQGLVRVPGRVLEIIRRDGEMMDRAERGRSLILIRQERVKAALAVGAVVMSGAALIAPLGQMPMSSRKEAYQ